MADYIRRLPVYLLLDCSGSMMGEPIEAVRQGVKALLSELKGDPQALETAYLSVITFDSSARQVIPLTELMQFQAGAQSLRRHCSGRSAESADRLREPGGPQVHGHPERRLASSGFPPHRWCTVRSGDLPAGGGGAEVHEGGQYRGLCGGLPGGDVLLETNYRKCADDEHPFRRRYGPVLRLGFRVH